jgi:putative ABC transport system permease protein
MDASLAGYSEERSKPLYLAALDRVRALPGVESASLASMVPFGMFTDGRQVQRLEAVGKTNAAPAAAPVAGGASTYGINGASAASASTDPDKPVSAIYTIAGTDYFRTLGLPLLRGREFDRLEAGAGTGARVAVIDEPLARRLWPGEDPLGRYVTFTEFGGEAASKAMQVVGVVPAIRNDLVEPEAQPHVYVPYGQASQSMMNLHVRTSGRGREAELSVLRSVRQTLRQLDDRLPVLAANRLSDFHNEGLLMWFMKTGARMFALLGVVAVFLAVVGVYGVKAYVVARRTREIGIRMALGATQRQVVWLVLRDGLRLTLVGVVTGLLLSLGAGQLLSSRLYEVSGADPLTFAGATLLLTGAALVACWLPARRAARVAPMTALRCE